MSTTAAPFVYWAQDNDKIFLRVDLRDAKDVNIALNNKKLEFSANGHGGQGNRGYQFCLNLTDNVKNAPTFKTTGSQIDIELAKVKGEFWKNLITELKKPHWLKFDFSRWKDSDESDHEMDHKNDFMSNEDKMKEWAKKFGGTLPEGRSSGSGYENFPMDFLYFKTFWETRRLAFYTCTALQYIDVFHGFIGITKSGWSTGIIQVTGRLVMLAIIDNCPYLHDSVTTYLLMFVYFLVEQFRYPYYAVSALGIELYFLTWLRYSIWILLYPSGLVLEAISIIRSIPYYYESGKWSIPMPNSLNFSFNFGIFLAIFVTTVFPKIAHTLLSHMRRQRSKKFANKGKKQV
uniref:Very-long-chain (3R)-3-hydroxyacyl-CoA dehydratase n=1 Tax=Panagrolaimus davidi TaxID=227884 RepID=A0A914QMK4_9BILA